MWCNGSDSCLHTKHQRPAVQKLVSLTLGQTFKQLVHKFEKISSEILSESVEVIFPKVLE